MNLFNLFGDGFGPHKIVVEEVSSTLSQSLPDVIQISQVSPFSIHYTFYMTYFLKQPFYAYLDWRYHRN